MNKSQKPNKPDRPQRAGRSKDELIRYLRNALRVAQEKADKSDEDLKKMQDIKALFKQLVAFIEEQGNVAYIASLRIALIASAFNAFAWVAAFLLIAFDNPTAAYFAAAGGFGATGVIFLLAAFKRDWLERVKSIFARRRR